MYSDIALLVLRLTLGLLLFGHGAQKLFGWFGGHGLKGTAGWLASMGMRPANFWAVVAGASEAGGGLLLALGFLSPFGPLGIIAAMLVAIITVHWNQGLWNAKNGIEFPLTNLVAALALALVGPGSLSLDAVLGIALPLPITFFVGLIAVLFGVFTAVGSQARQQVAQH